MFSQCVQCDSDCMFLHDTLLVVMFMVSEGSTQSLPHERAHATEPMDRQTRQMLSSPATGRSRTTWPARSRGTACTTPASTPPLRSGSRRISEPAAPQGLPRAYRLGGGGSEAPRRAAQALFPEPTAWERGGLPPAYRSRGRKTSAGWPNAGCSARRKWKKERPAGQLSLTRPPQGGITRRRHHKTCLKNTLIWGHWLR